jgi:formylglycine-generating enzyme
MHLVTNSIMTRTAIFTLLLCPLWIIRSATEKHVHSAVAPQQQPTAQTTTSDTIPQLPNPEMVLVEGGSYLMGLIHDAAGQGFGKTTRTHQVTLNSFKIGKYEVTQAEWRSVMGDSLNFSLHQGCAKCPVEEVSWNEVQLFIRKLNAMTGRHYQLPTEAQWEFAARGGNKSKGYKYAGSDYVNEVVFPGGTFTGKTHPVGDKRPNELGIYNMSGNVSEWCNDWFNPEIFPGTETDPRGPSSGFGHVIRGGSWGVHPSECEVTSFKMGYPNDRNARVGFRLVLIP